MPRVIDERTGNTLLVNANGSINVNVTAEAVPAAFYSGQAVIAVTGTALQLPAHVLVNGLCVKAKLSNPSDVIVGPAGVTNTEDGTGNGFILSPGDSITLSVSNSNLVFINGTAGNIASFLEN